MIRALMLDLDDTLLGNNMDTFMASYFALLRDFARPILNDETFLPHLIQATQAAIHNSDPALTNADVFWANFERLSGARRSELEPFFMRFYETEFSQLRAATVMRPAAADLVSTAIDQGCAVVVATNPLFPRTAIEQRLDWAGVPVDRYAYALVTTYEIMHATKPQPAYYREILDYVGCPAEAAMMVGDDWRNDIVPAATVGLRTFWIAPDDAEAPEPELLEGRGTLEQLARLVRDGYLEKTAPGRSR